MPELPEVETIKEILKESVCGKTIKKIKILHEKTIVGDADVFSKELIDAKIIDFSRVGKYIIFHFDKPYVIASHLRMEGKYFLRNYNEKIADHDMVLFGFSDGTYLAYNDTRRFGTLQLLPNDKYLELEPLSKVGPDPFMMKDSTKLIESFSNYSGSIKAALTDQSIMSGLGNIYVDEVLFMLGLHPETPAKIVSKETINKALEYSKIVLTKAIKAGGSTIHSYHPKEGMSGKFQVELQVYGKAGEKCPRCGATIRKIVVNGRGTSYCPHCQKNPKIPYILGVTGPIGSGKTTVSKYLQSKGFTYISADDIVHELYRRKEVQDNIRMIIPSLKLKDNEIDRDYLKNYLIDNIDKKKRLQKYVWDLVESEFLKKIKRAKTRIVFEVPMLFESKLNEYCDETLVVVNEKVNQQKHLEIRNDNVEKSLKLNNTYNPENIKKATYIIENNSDVANLYNKLNSIFVD